jgi:hypothetical protein
MIILGWNFWNWANLINIYTENTEPTKSDTYVFFYLKITIPIERNQIYPVIVWLLILIKGVK